MHSPSHPFVGVHDVDHDGGWLDLVCQLLHTQVVTSANTVHTFAHGTHIAHTHTQTYTHTVTHTHSHTHTHTVTQSHTVTQLPT